MRGLSVIAFVACLAITSVVHAEPVGVTVEASKDTINIGETGTFTVYGQLLTGHTGAGNGVFGWDVDLRIADPTIIELLPATFALPPGVWTSNAMTSSQGTPMAWGLDAIYNTGEDSTEIGIDARVELFSVDYRGVAEGTTTLSVEPDLTTGADFATWQGESGGDYSQASGSITVVPEPATLGLLGLGGLLLIRRLRG